MKLKHTGHGQAHGKLILIGEHAVVYQQPAIAIPFQAAQVKVTLQHAAYDEVYSALYSGRLELSPDHFRHLKELILALKAKFKLEPVSVAFESSIPISAGMGSSAALASACIEAFYHGMDKPLSAEERFEWTQFAEKIAHGNPSGIDALSTTQASAWWYVKGSRPLAIDLFLPGVLVVANSEVKGSTKVAVEGVAQRLQENPKLMDHISSIGLLAHDAKQAIESKTLETLGQTLSLAHQHLKTLGVSHPKLDAMVTTALQAGALGAKMTGGGLGGCVLALARNQADAERISHALKQHSFALWTHPLNA